MFSNVSSNFLYKLLTGNRGLTLDYTSQKYPTLKGYDLDSFFSTAPYYAYPKSGQYSRLKYPSYKSLYTYPRKRGTSKWNSLWKYFQQYYQKPSYGIKRPSCGSQKPSCPSSHPGYYGGYYGGYGGYYGYPSYPNGAITLNDVKSHLQSGGKIKIHLDANPFDDSKDYTNPQTDFLGQILNKSIYEVSYANGQTTTTGLTEIGGGKVQQATGSCQADLTKNEICVFDRKMRLEEDPLTGVVYIVDEKEGRIGTVTIDKSASTPGQSGR